MFKVLIADDNYEDRELLKLEIRRAIVDKEPDLRFYEASSIKQALQLLTAQFFDLLTIDIEFDHMIEGLEALPDIFETYPTLNIIVISGKLNKNEVLEHLFRFTKDNVLKEKRWVRHFDVLDKKDDKTEALLNAYNFALGQREVSGKVRELFLLAESYLEKDMMDKCLEVYQRIQKIAPGEIESKENITICQTPLSPEQALEYYRKGEKIVASLLLGHYIEKQLKAYTETVLGHTWPVLHDCLKALEGTDHMSYYKKRLFHLLLRLRNKSIHQPASILERDFGDAVKNLKLLEETL